MQRKVNSKHVRKQPRNAYNASTPNSGTKPTLILKGRYVINQNLTAVNLKQINIIPTLSTLGLDVVA